MEKPASADHARSRLRLGALVRPERCFGAICRFDSKPCTTAIASASSGANEALPTKVFHSAKKVELAAISIPLRLPRDFCELVHQVRDRCSGVAIKMGCRRGATREH